MKSAFHEGELAVQEKAGVASMAARIGGSIKAAIHPYAEEFLAAQPFVIGATTDAGGNAWPSALYGREGFARVTGSSSVSISPANSDVILEGNIRETGRLGLLAIEFETRTRIRLNGKASIEGGTIDVEIEEFFSNCPKYIQARKVPAKIGAPRGSYSDSGTSLTGSQLSMIEGADTLFLASYHSDRGADASHRGGNPGFVKILDAQTLLIPDYSGNNMFQTLGNIESNGRAGLLFIDFETGRTLQMTGRAEILWDKKDFERLQGANRALRFGVEKVVDTENAFPTGWEFVDYSPVNP